MKTIKIAHLYYDLLNLYGEQGNIMAIKKAFNNQNIDADISFLSVNNKISFDFMVDNAIYTPYIFVIFSVRL